MATHEIANRESPLVVINKNPDMCIVGDCVIPFDIMRDLVNAVEYSPNVNARGEPILRVSSKIQGVVGNAGSGVSSGVSQGAGYIIVENEGSAKNVLNGGFRTARNLTQCTMNCHAAGGTNNVTGIIYTGQSGPLKPTNPKLPCNDPPKTSDKLQELEKLKQYFAALDPDQYVDFDSLDKLLSDTIAAIHPGTDSLLRQPAGVARALLGAGKGAALDAGEMLYALAKFYPTNNTIHRMIDDAILAENIRLGNVCLGTVTGAIVDAVESAIASVMDPAAKGEWGEALTNGVLMVFSAIRDAVRGVVKKAPKKPGPKEPAAGSAPKETDVPTREDGAKVHKKRMEKISVSCYNASNVPKEHLKEFDYQLAEQNKYLNEMTVEDYLNGRAYYAEFGRKGAAAAAEVGRQEAEAFMQEFYKFRYTAAEMDVAAERWNEAKIYLDTLVFLHDPDMVLGGKATPAGGGISGTTR